MLKVIRTPFEKITDKEIKRVSERTTDVRRETGQHYDLADVRDAIAQGYARHFGVDLAPSDWSADEVAAIQQLEQSRYLDPQWVDQVVAVPDSFGVAKLKTSQGLLDIRVTLAGRMIKAVFVSGDFFADEGAVAALEQSLRWHSSSATAVAKTLATVYERHGKGIGLALPDLQQALTAAIKQGLSADTRRRADPYGCFVTPGGAPDEPLSI